MKSHAVSFVLGMIFAALLFLLFSDAGEYTCNEIRSMILSTESSLATCKNKLEKCNKLIGVENE